MTRKEKRMLCNIKKLQQDLKDDLKKKNFNVADKGGSGNGQGSYRLCQWIDMDLDKEISYSILFYEEARIKGKDGIVRPGRYGFVVFQKWDNMKKGKRRSPNVLMEINGVKGIFVPFDKQHRLETGIKATPQNEEEILQAFLKFAGKE